MRYTEGRPWPSEMSQPIDPPNRKKAWPWVLLGALLLLCCGVSLPLVAASLDEDRSAAVYVSDPSTGKAVGETVSKAASGIAIGEGQWIVGEDVQPGRYKTDGADPDLFTLCVWTVYAKEGGDVVDFGTSGEQNAPGRVVLKKGQFFDTTGCKPWIRQTS